MPRAWATSYARGSRRPVRDPTDRRARLAALGLYIVLVSSVIFWALLIWHPWIDWFGRPR
jgi:hypothetical protein